MINFYIQVEDVAGVKLGAGPITSARSWSSTRRMSRAGAFSFSMPASDPQADLLVEKRRVRAYAQLDDVWTEIGDGIIDQIDTDIGADGTVTLTISGPDGLGELAGYLAQGAPLSSSGNPEPVSYVVTWLSFVTNVYANPNWGFTAVDITAAELYGQWFDETILGALIVVAEKSGGNFYYAGGRLVVFFTGFTASGIRAIDAQGDLATETCAITSIKKSVETHELVTRVLPRGSGTGLARLGLNACTRTPPAGYTLNLTVGRLSLDAAVTAYGIIDRLVEFKDIFPISNTDADLTAAANALYDSAKLYLDVYSTRATSYTLSVAGCSALLRPGQTIQVDYHDPLAGITINEALYIIEATIKVDENELQTTDLIVSTQARWPLTDGEVLASRIAEGRIFQANPQLNANSYTTGYTKNVDDTETASFRFRFGGEVTQIQQVLFEFQLLPFESTVKSVGGSSTSTGSGGGSTVSSTSGGGATSSASGTHTHDVTPALHNHTVSVSAHAHEVTLSNHTHDVTVSAHTHSVTIGTHTHTVTISSHSHNLTLHGTSGDPTGSHPLARVVYFDVSDDNFYIEAGGTDQSATTESGGSSSPTSSSGGSSTPTSSSGGGGTVTSSDGGGTTLTSGSGGSSTPTSSNGGGTTATSASGGSHDHTVSAHTHDVTVGNHTHSVTAAISAVYGIFRESALNTYAIADLEYRVNAGAWISLDTAGALAGDWYTLDVTSQVYSATTFRPLQAGNALQIRRKAAAVANKTVTIDALLSVRTTIQSITFV